MTYKKKLLLTVAGIAVAIQFIRPDFHNPEVNEAVALHADKEVTAILQSACYDCHSDETKYPWYSNIAPVSWFMANHINSGRKALNFSQWETIDPSVRIARMERAEHLLHIKLMPLGSYTMMHDGADLTDAQRTKLAQFFGEQIKALKAAEGKPVNDDGFTGKVEEAQEGRV